MELIFLIFKIILIAFLIVLGLIVLLLATVLFVPIRYEVSGSIGDSWELKVQGKVTYLLSIIKLLFFYEKEQFDMKFFLFNSEKKMDKGESEDTKNAESDEEEPVVTVQEISEINAESKEIKQESANTSEAIEVTTSDTSEVSIDVLETKSKSEPKPQKHKEEAKPKKKKEKEQSKGIDIAFIKEQLTDEHNKSVVHKLWSELLYLLRHFKFRKIVTDLRFATGDPALTGQTLGVMCMIPTLYRYDFKITPDFEADEVYVKGTFLVAGKVRLIHLLVTILRLIFDKEVRLVVKRILALLEK